MKQRCWFGIFLLLWLVMPGVLGQEPDLSELSLQELMDIEVTTASRGGASLADSPAVISVITADDIADIGAQDLAEVLALVPGFEVNRAIMFGTHHSIGVRGRMTDFGEDVLVMIDGQRLNEVYTGGGLTQLKHLPVESIERIELIRGPGSTLYGSNAFVGIVHIITRSSDVTNGGGVSLQAGSHAAKKGAVAFSRAWGAGHFRLNAGWATDDGDTYAPKRGFLRPPVSLPSIQDPVERALDLNVGLTIGNFQLDAGLVERKLDGFMPWGFLDKAWESDILDTNQDDARVLRLQADYWHMFASGLTVKVAARYLEGEIRDLYFLAAPGVPAFSQGTSVAEVGWLGSPNHDTSGSEFEVQFNYSAGNHDIVGGALYGIEELTGAWNRFNFFPFPTELELVDYGSQIHWFDGPESYADLIDRNISAFYLQDTWHAAEKVSLTLGLRHDRYNDFGDTTNPSLGLVYRPSERFFLKALYGQAFRAPTFNELYVRNNPVQRGNEDLSAQTIQTAEVNLNLVVNSNLIATLSVYNNRYTDLINLINMAPLPTFFNADDPEKDLGGELEVRYKRDRHKTFSAALAWIDPELGDGSPRPYIARLKASFLATYDFGGKVVTHFNARYLGDRVNPTLDPLHDMDDVWILNGHLRVPELFMETDLSLTLKNLTDEQWQSPGFSYALTPDHVPNRGFEVGLGLKKTF